MKKTLTLLAILALGLTACNKEIDAPQEIPEQTPDVLSQAPACFFNLPASFDGDASTKAVSIGESTATTTFEASDRVDIVLVRTDNTSTIKAYSQNPSTYEYIPLTVTPDPSNPALATLSGQLAFYYWDQTDFFNPKAIAFEPATGDEVYLFYNMNDDCLELFKYHNQNGKLEGRTDPKNDPYDYYWGARNHDYAMAKMKVRSATGNTTDGFMLELEQYDDNTKTDVNFQNLGSLFRQRLSFKDKDNQTVTPLPTLSDFVIEAENGKVVRAYDPWETPANAYYLYGQLTLLDPELTSDGDIYFAMAFNDDNKSKALKMTAYAQDGNVYTVTKNAPTSGFANGKYYHGNSTLSWKHQVFPVILPDSGYIYGFDSDVANATIRGDFPEYYFIFMHYTGTTTVTLGGNGTGTWHRGPDEPFLYFNSDASIILESDYTINCSASDNAIWVSSELKLSTTGGSHTLTLIVNSTARKAVAKPFGAAATVTGADGFTATLTTDGQDNGDDTYTYVYTVAQN